MNSIYTTIGTTKQNVHQMLDRQLAIEDEQAQLILLMEQIREEHPGLGAKIMYQMLGPVTMGRDRFIRFYMAMGFKLTTPKNYQKTTDSNGVIRFENLILDLELEGINQLWVSDITYILVDGRFYYLTFIMDAYSRLIIGYSASKTLRTIDTTIPAIKMALKRLKQSEPMPILHSDGGGQYYCKEFLKLTKDKLRNSMGKTAYENPQAERINGTIKNDYIIPWAPANYQQLTKLLGRAVNNYNIKRPHRSLKLQTPWQFDQQSKFYQQNDQLLTKEKRSKKENINNDNNNFVKSSSKTVNSI